MDGQWRDAKKTKPKRGTDQLLLILDTVENEHICAVGYYNTGKYCNRGWFFSIDYEKLPKWLEVIGYQPLPRKRTV
jgi:hypothetical protein